MRSAFHRRPRGVVIPGKPRKPRLVIPPCPSSRLVVVDGTARFTIDRALHSPNKTFWASPLLKKRDRDSWGVAIYNAIVIYLEAQSQALNTFDRQRIANRPVPVDVTGKRVMRRLHRAPRQVYRVLITREVPSKANFIKDDDNLAFAGKALRDALKAHCVIFEDSREWLVSPDPIQRVAEDGQFRTIVDVTPWAPPRLSGEPYVGQ